MAEKNHAPQDHYRKRVASLSRYDAQQLDNGVTGKEILSGSRDLQSLPERMLSALQPIDARMESSTKMAGIRPVRHEQVITDNLRMLGWLALSLSRALRFIDAHKRRSRNRPYPVGLCKKCCGNELIEVVSHWAC